MPKTPSRQPLTIMEFLDALAATPRDWKLASCGGIHRPYRTPGASLCTWSAVVGYGGLRDVVNRDVTRRIWAANDNERNHDPTIRAALLSACGLSNARAARPGGRGSPHPGRSTGKLDPKII